MLTHTFKTKSHNLGDLFNKTNKFSLFLNKLDKQSDIDVLRYPKNKYLGDGLEFFVELFLYLHPVDNRIGIYNYQPNQKNDNGVDGTGINILCEKSVAQIKYRSNSNKLLTATDDKLSNLFSDGMLSHNVISDNDNPKNIRHFVFTTAKGLNHYTDNEMFKNKVKCFGYDEFRQFLDNNLIFWKKANEIIEILNSTKS